MVDAIFLPPKEAQPKVRQSHKFPRFRNNARKLILGPYRTPFDHLSVGKKKEEKFEGKSINNTKFGVDPTVYLSIFCTYLQKEFIDSNFN